MTRPEDFVYRPLSEREIILFEELGQRQARIEELETAIQSACERLRAALAQLAEA